jgi:hypothetical protein
VRGDERREARGDVGFTWEPRGVGGDPIEQASPVHARPRQSNSRTKVRGVRLVRRHRVAALM